MNKEEIKKKVLESIEEESPIEVVLDVTKFVDLVIEEIANAIFEEIEFAGGKGREFLPEKEAFVITLKSWKKLKEKWLKWKYCKKFGWKKMMM